MMPFTLRVVAGCVAFLPALAAAAETGAVTVRSATPVAAAPVAPVLTEAPGAPARREPAGTAALTDTQQYCQNIAAAAADARFAWQRKQLTDLQAQIKQRVVDLQAKQAELEAAMARHTQMAKKASDAVVGIYSHMKPDAAATQLAALDEDMAASILTQLTQKQASVILNEIPADKAAKLVTAMTAAFAPEKKS